MEHGAGVGRQAGEIEFEKNWFILERFMVRSEGGRICSDFNELPRFVKPKVHV
jgi:hypothetical protein